MRIGQKRERFEAHIDMVLKAREWFRSKGVAFNYYPVHVELGDFGGYECFNCRESIESQTVHLVLSDEAHKIETRRYFHTWCFESLSVVLVDILPAKMNEGKSTAVYSDGRRMHIPIRDIRG